MSVQLQVGEFNQSLLDFLASSPTPFHATSTLVDALVNKGFTLIHEQDFWTLTPGNKYVFTRNQSSVIAFIYGEDTLLESGIRMLGAHTDSPCLKLKPNPELNRHGYYQLGVEVYGGALLAPWFDRDLSMAGRVTFKNTAGNIESCLIDFKRALAIIPSLAIHLDREANAGRNINPQCDIIPVLMQLEQGKLLPNLHELLAAQVAAEHPYLTITADAILDFEISFYDTQTPAVIGVENQFIASARLDNLLSCFVGLKAICEATTQVSSIFICTDHEEVGSASCCGAKGPMLEQFLERLLPDAQERFRVLEKSLMISADNAHGIHPNFSDRHDENHKPMLNQGPVIKVNANQRYATTSETSAVFKLLCDKTQVPFQTFVARTDMGCGSTIGPIVASEVGVRTLDVGVPTFAMHSIRELAGTLDAWYLYQVAAAFFNYQEAPVPSHRLK